MSNSWCDPDELLKLYRELEFSYPVTPMVERKTMIRIRPQNDWVLVEPLAETKRGALFIPEMAQEGQTYQVGRVKALPPQGKAELNFNIDCSVGDVVVYDTRATVKASAYGEELTLTRARDIAAVVG